MTVLQPTAEKLKQAGWEKETNFYYERYKSGRKWTEWERSYVPTDGLFYSIAIGMGLKREKLPAPSTDELLEALPKTLKLDYVTHRLTIVGKAVSDQLIWEVCYADYRGDSYFEEDVEVIENINLCEALAELWLELRKEGLV